MLKRDLYKGYGYWWCTKRTGMEDKKHRYKGPAGPEEGASTSAPVTWTGRSNVSPFEKLNNIVLNTNHCYHHNLY